MLFFLLVLSNIFLITVELGVLAFIFKILILSVAVILKIIQKKKLGKTKS